GVKSARPFSARTLVIAAVSVVLPWSMWPMVPMFTWGLVRSNFFFAMLPSPSPSPSAAYSPRTLATISLAIWAGTSWYAWSCMGVCEARPCVRELRGVDRVVRPAHQGGPDVHQRVPGEDARLAGLLDALVDRGDVLAGDVPAGDLVDELVAAAGARGLEIDDHVPVLASAAGLADELPLHLVDGLADGLAIGHLRLADVGPDVDLSREPVHQDLEVELAHAGDDRLAGLLVVLHDEGGVLVGQLGQ